jgi:signal transduction histidine kinase
VIQTRRESEFAVLSVMDRGYGLSAEEQARVFQPFYRSPEARSRGQAGVGLGLAVAERIVAVFGGKIRLDSESGVGTRFEILLLATSGERLQARAWESADAAAGNGFPDTRRD